MMMNLYTTIRHTLNCLRYLKHKYFSREINGILCVTITNYLQVKKGYVYVQSSVDEKNTIKVIFWKQINKDFIFITNWPIQAIHTQTIKYSIDL